MIEIPYQGEMFDAGNLNLPQIPENLKNEFVALWHTIEIGSDRIEHKWNGYVVGSVGTRIGSEQESAQGAMEYLSRKKINLSTHKPNVMHCQKTSGLQ